MKLPKIEEIPEEQSLFKLTREEGIVIKQGNTYWMYEIEYEGCEVCEMEEEHRGWKNVTDIIIMGRQEILDELSDLSCREAPNVCSCCEEVDELRQRYEPAHSKKNKEVTQCKKQ